jgi:hypothetical protein
MKPENDKKLSGLNKDKEMKENAQGYPLYPSDDDIYNKFHEEKKLILRVFLKIKNQMKLMKSERATKNLSMMN